MKPVIHRLRRLETQFRSALEAQRPRCTSPLPLIVALLDRWGIVREGNESIMEMFARAIGWTPRQLKAEIERRANRVRVSPVHAGRGADYHPGRVYRARRKQGRRTPIYNSEQPETSLARLLALETSRKPLAIIVVIVLLLAF